MAATDPYALYNATLGSDARGGITRSGSSGSYSYSVKSNMGDKPVNSGATFYMPTEDQWYKAAFYKGSGTDAGYWQYATQVTGTAPTPLTSGTTGIGTAGGVGNFAHYNLGADWNGQDGNVTTVGSSGGPSYYGAFDMSGNVWEWNDLTGAAGSSRGLRGADWLNGSAFELSSSFRVAGDPPSGEDNRVGFRLAAVPEPASLGLTATGGLAARGWTMFRRRRRTFGACGRFAGVTANGDNVMSRFVCQESRTLMVCFAAAAVAAPARAQIGWNAYNDFYLSPTAAGCGGATSPSATGAAWGYYTGNVNGVDGFPSNIGTYLSTSQLYRFASANPLGVSGTVRSQSFWDSTGGAGFARYVDNVDWNGTGVETVPHSSLGSYSEPWFFGAPGLGNGPGDSNLTNLIWMQSAFLQSGSSSPTGEGIASVLTWTAPATKVWDSSGLFVSGDASTKSAAVAIMDRLGGTAPLSRTVLANSSVQSFSFSQAYNAGDVVQFQLGNNLSSGNVVGLQVSIVPEPSTWVM